MWKRTGIAGVIVLALGVAVLARANVNGLYVGHAIDGGWSQISTTGYYINGTLSIQESVHVSGSTIPSLSIANSLAIGAAKLNSALGLTLTRGAMVASCLVTGAGVGSTSVVLRDVTASSSIMSTTGISCVCTPGTLFSAAAASLSVPDNDVLSVQLGTTAATDCVTYPVLVVNSTLSAL